MSCTESEIFMVISWRRYPGVKAYWFNTLHLLHGWRMTLWGGLMTGYAHFQPKLHQKKPTKTIFWSRSPLWHLRYSMDHLTTLQMLSKRCWCRCRSAILWLWLNDGQNPHFGCAILLIYFPKVVDGILPSQLCQFIKLHLLLPRSLHPLLYRFGDCAHRPAELVIFAQHALLSLFIILISPILPIVRNCEITHTVSNSKHHLLKSHFRLSGHQSCDLSMIQIFLLVLNCCLCIFNSLSCPSSCSLNIILNPFAFLFIPYKMHFSSFVCCKLVFGSQVTQCLEGSNSFCLQVALALIRLMTSLGRVLFPFAISTHRKWWHILFRIIVHFSLPWFCCWEKRWMLQDMDNTEASFVFYVKVGMFNPLEYSKTSLLTDNESGIVRLTEQRELKVSVSFMYYPGDSFRQTSADVLSLEPCSIYSWKWSNFGCCTLQFIPVLKQSTTDGNISQARGSRKPLQLAAIRSWIHLEYNELVGTLLVHSVMKLTI